MIRFPNPGSDIASFIRIYKTLHTHLKEKSWFTLDDMSATLTSSNLAASSGHVGEKALALSTRKDRSRDPLYNQSKMYAELFRTLGWIVSDDPNAALRFRFTLLGDHAAIAHADPKAIFEESILGINYPNQILAIKGTEASRVFSTILRVASRLDGYICRDEIILGVLNHDDDETNVEYVVNTIRKMRKSIRHLAIAMENMSDEKGIQINTMRNYTRFPLAVMTYCDWLERESTKRFYPDGYPTIMYKQTPYGLKRANEIEQAVDFRLSDYERSPSEKQNAMIRLGFYTMLQRANFDISPAIAQIANDHRLLRKEVDGKDVVFSPYQTVRPEVADDALGHTRGQPSVINTENKVASPTIPYSLDPIGQQTTVIRLPQLAGGDIITSTSSEIESRIVELNREGYPDLRIADTLFSEYITTNKDVFYPLVTDLFTLIGFDCQVSRTGINYERWDAIAIDSAKSVPIEIKSPTEELYISIKAIRQALENKIVLLSRKSYSTDWETVSLAVGYNPPNERAEVSRLIADIKNAFGIKIGVIDFHSLLMLVPRHVNLCTNDTLKAG